MPSDVLTPSLFQLPELSLLDDLLNKGSIDQDFNDRDTIP